MVNLTNLQRISKKWAVWDQEGGRTEGAKWWNPIARSTSISCPRRAAFGPAGPVPANGPTAMRVLQSTYALKLTGCISPIPWGSGVGNGKTWPRPSPFHVRCRFGGSRAYFICPGPRDGSDCGRRITKLHLSRRPARSLRQSERDRDVHQLSETGCLRPGWSSACQWTDGNEGASINLRAEADWLHISYLAVEGAVDLADDDCRPRSGEGAQAADYAACRCSDGVRGARGLIALPAPLWWRR
jgi:hypothetical protein